MLQPLPHNLPTLSVIGFAIGSITILVAAAGLLYFGVKAIRGHVPLRISGGPLGVALGVGIAGIGVFLQSWQYAVHVPIIHRWFSAGLVAFGTLFWLTSDYFLKKKQKQMQPIYDALKRAEELKASNKGHDG